MELLVSFHCQCRGVKFYDLRSAGAEWGTKLDLVKEPTTPHDLLCVTAWVPGIPGEKERDAGVRQRMLGDVAKEAVRWLSPVLLVPTLRVTNYVTYEPYSRVPDDRNWQHRVVDMDVFINGPPYMLPRLQEVFKGKNIDVHGLMFGPFDRYGQQIRDDDRTSTEMETESTVAGNPTTKTELTMDDFWDMICP